MVIRCVYVELFTGDDEVAGSGVLKCVNVVLSDEELLLLAAHKCQWVQEYAIQLSVALSLATLGGTLAHRLWLALFLYTEVGGLVVEEEWHV